MRGSGKRREVEAPMIYLGIVEQEKINRLVTMHTSIARGDVWCKYQISPALPQGPRSLTEEEEEEDDEKIAYEKNLL